jgi:DNA repair photolyase
MYIYEPKGKAGEYGKFALNLYEGCTHGCKYCYVPAIRRKTPEAYAARAVERNFRWDALAEEIRLLKGQSLFLCFTCDPYQPLNDGANYTRRVIKMCHENGVAVTILTKGGKRSEDDLNYWAENSIRSALTNYGATLTFLNDADSRAWEPGAALPVDRIAMLRKAHAMGIPTWASLEPVIDPAQSLEIIDRCHEFVDVFKVGKWNHDIRANAIDWRAFGREAIGILKRYGNRYYIKNDLAMLIHQQTI